MKSRLRTHTANPIEGLWNIFKHGIVGTFHIARQPIARCGPLKDLAVRFASIVKS
jgi:hypothetical protein